MRVHIVGTCAVMMLMYVAPALLTAQAIDPASPDTVRFVAPRGNITFTHNKHAEYAECRSCHHESKAEKPLESEFQKCTACHTNPATEPVTTALKDALHNTSKKEGLCYNCHTAEISKGTEGIPKLCADCHKRQPSSSPRP
jgi:hypothetical protein